MSRVLLTRPVGQGDDLVASLERHGIAVAHVPSIAIAPTPDDQLHGAIATLRAPDWLVVTSVNGAAAVLRALGRNRLARGVRVAAIGPATAHRLQQAGVRVSAVPRRYLSAEIAEAMGSVAGTRVVLARADQASPRLAEALAARGAQVEQLVAYRILEGPDTSREAAALALAAGLEAILFTSGSSVRGLLALLPEPLRDRARAVPAICIGPVTAAAAAGAGFRVAAVADEHTAAGLLRATIGHFAAQEVA